MTPATCLMNNLLVGRMEISLDSSDVIVACTSQSKVSTFPPIVYVGAPFARNLLVVPHMGTENLKEIASMVKKMKTGVKIERVN